jgi:xylulokinase
MAGIMGIDRDWKAVTPYDSWLDTRCSSQVAEIDRKAAGLVAQKTGNIPSYNHGPKILWWKEERGEVYKRVHRFIQPAAYVGGRLCGLRGDDAFIDWTYLHFSGFADNRSLRWDDELTGMFDVSQDKLPRIVSPLTIIGHTEEKEAALFGLRAGTPVAAGCGDTASCFIGTGATEAGIAVDVAGTASVFALTTNRFLADPGGMVYTARSVLEDTWYSMSYINGGGLNLEWFSENFGSGRSLHELNKSIKGLNPGSDGLIFVPHLEGRAYPNTPAMRGHWMGFTRSHTAAHFFRSILEGIGYEVCSIHGENREWSWGDAFVHRAGSGGRLGERCLGTDKGGYLRLQILYDQQGGYFHSGAGPHCCSFGWPHTGFTNVGEAYH